MSSKNQPQEVKKAREARWVAANAARWACDQYFANPTPENKARWEAAAAANRQASDNEQAVFSKYAS